MKSKEITLNGRHYMVIDAPIDGCDIIFGHSVIPLAGRRGAMYYRMSIIRRAERRLREFFGIQVIYHERSPLDKKLVDAVISMGD